MDLPVLGNQASRVAVGVKSDEGEHARGYLPQTPIQV